MFSLKTSGPTDTLRSYFTLFRLHTIPWDFQEKKLSESYRRTGALWFGGADELELGGEAVLRLPGIFRI